MAKSELLLPAMGEGIIEATITKWLVNEGDNVQEDQPLLEIATDKVDSEIPSPVSGTISKIVRQEGEVPAIGDILAILETEAVAKDPGREEVMKEVGRIEGYKATSAGKDTGHPIQTAEGSKLASEVPRQTPSGKLLTPLVRNIARKENIAPQELDQIQGSGEGGRIVKQDLLTFIEKRREGVQEAGIPPGNAESLIQKTGFNLEAGDKVIEMDRMRKLISHHMVRSKQISPHVTAFIDADVTNLVKWRESVKEDFENRENQKITLTPIFVEATAKALREHPMINVSVDGTSIIVKKNINIGIAVALDNGNLIVPVIRNADEKNLIGLVKAVNDLAKRARSNSIRPDEITGGTFTITNFGTFKNTFGTPIINQPEVAILGTGAIIKKPVVIETAQGDAIAIRQIMTLSLSFDHRVVDGALGGIFLKTIADYLENFNLQRTI